MNQNNVLPVLFSLPSKSVKIIKDSFKDFRAYAITMSFGDNRLYFHVLMIKFLQFPLISWIYLSDKNYSFY